MDKKALTVKYESLVSEWNTIFLTSSVLFSACIIGLSLGFVFRDMYVLVISIVLMVIFGAFEYRSRKFYVEAKAEIEKKLGIKGQKNELVEKGLVW